jgi:pyruvate,orthophosphate dikinase
MIGYIFDSDHPHAAYDRGLADLLGGKGASLAVMSAKLGLSVPPAFTLSIEAFHRWRREGDLAFVHGEIDAAVARLETRLHRKFGGEARPLVVSIRSGAPASMPGMMDTILDLGLNRVTAAALAREFGDQVADSAWIRFRASFAQIVGVAAPEDPRDQLNAAVVAVFSSCDSPRAIAYRKRAGLSDEMGTAATVQSMVFGTAPGFSGTGVAFTRDPSNGDSHPVGDWLPNAQGEDVVSGSHRSLPLPVLATQSPAVWHELERAFRTLEAWFQDMCDVEFTVEAGKLWILQCRVGKRSPLARIRVAVDLAEDPRFHLTREDALRGVSVEDLRAALGGDRAGVAALPIAVGLGASPGIAAGKASFTSEAAMAYADAGEPTILIRRETAPEDIPGMAAAGGILTATGGLVSHAAIVAREWCKPAVVGVETLDVAEDRARIGPIDIQPGDVVTIDGTTGRVFLGTVEAVAATSDGKVERFIGWAREISGLSEEGNSCAVLARAHANLVTMAQSREYRN